MINFEEIQQLPNDQKAALLDDLNKAKKAHEAKLKAEREEAARKAAEERAAIERAITESEIRVRKCLSRFVEPLNVIVDYKPLVVISNKGVRLNGSLVEMHRHNQVLTDEQVDDVLYITKKITRHYKKRGKTEQIETIKTNWEELVKLKTYNGKMFAPLSKGQKAEMTDFFKNL